MNKFIAIFGLALFLLGDSIAAPNMPTRVRDMEEIPDLFEGDIIVPPGGLRNGIVDEKYRWPNATVIYQFDPTFSSVEREKILTGWAEIENTTCIRFREKTVNDPDFVFVRRGASGSGCSSNVGRIGGQQARNSLRTESTYEKSMNLEAPSCTDRHGSLIHEMLHTIGFHHEQSRPDRDDFVTVVWDKIEPGKEHNFNKYDFDESTTFGAPYDYGSVLHYSGTGFSIDGSPTIVPKIPGVTIGQRIAISQLDAGKVMLMYNCPLKN